MRVDESWRSKGGFPVLARSSSQLAARTRRPLAGNSSKFCSHSQFRNITYSNRPDSVAQLAEHWASIPKVVGSILTVARHIFQACPVWIYTQSNITNIIFTWVHNTKTKKNLIKIPTRSKTMRVDESWRSNASERYNSQQPSTSFDRSFRG